MRTTRYGFTLIELLVAIAIIGILVALLLPAVQAAREAARRMQCANHLKQIALALHNYETTHRTFPPGALVADNSCTASLATKRQAPWTVRILPYIEQETLYEQFQMSGSFAALQGDVPPEPSNNAAAQNTPLPAFRCPSDPAVQREDPSLNYLGVQGGGPELAANCRTGTALNYRVRFENGILGTNHAVRIRKIVDGTSNTMLVGETRWWSYRRTNVGFPSWFAWSSANRTDGTSSHTIVLAAAVDSINNPLVDYDSNQGWVDASGAFTNTLYLGTHTRCFGSRHPGGAHFALADGSIQLLADELDLTIYRCLATIHDGLPAAGFQP